MFLQKLAAVVVLVVVAIAAGVAYQQQETNSLKRDLAQMTESQALWKYLASDYQRNFETTQVAFRLMPREQSSPLARAIMGGCYANCETLRVADVAPNMVFAIGTSKNICASIMMPDRVFVQEPPTPNNTVVVGTQEVIICMNAVIFATHGPIVE